MAAGEVNRPAKTDGIELQGWKEIAGHFGVTVRTVQLWEAEKGLPVSRLPGERGRVYARLNDLEAWREGAQPAPPPVAASATPRRWWRWVAGALVVSAALAICLYWWTLQRRAPATARVDLRVLVAFDELGSELWRRPVPHEPVQPDPNQAPGVLVTDLDSDGSNEVLYLARAAGDHLVSDEVWCHAPSGRLLWKWRAGARVRTPGDGEFTDSYRVSRWMKWQRGLVVIARHAPEYPSQVALVSPDGQTLRQYWHSGQLNQAVAADTDGDQRAELWLGGVANGHKRGVIVVLDPGTMLGASLEANPAYQIEGRGAPREIARALMPRTSANLQGGGSNVVSALWASGRDVLASVAELDNRHGPGPHALVVLSGRGQVKRAGFQDGADAYYRELVRSGAAAAPLFERDRALLARLDWITPWRR